MKRLMTTWIIIFFSFTMIACQSSTIQSNKPIVAVSIVPQKAFVEAVAGDLVDIITIIPPGYSPGNYEPSSRTMEEVTEAQVYFTIGVPAEAGNILPDLEDITMVHLEEIVREEYPDRTFSGGGRDPHIWLSIKRVKLMIDTIKDTLISMDPEHQETYEANALAFQTHLDETDETLASMFDAIEEKNFIVFHPAFGYFADEYGLTMVAIEEDGKEATPLHLQDVIDLANALNIDAVFNQAEIDSSQVASFADEINAEIITLYPLSEDYIQNLLEMGRAVSEELK